ncbi:hypothetical protein D3C80_1543220 [compost metagenome]
MITATGNASLPASFNAMPPMPVKNLTRLPIGLNMVANRPPPAINPPAPNSPAKVPRISLPMPPMIVDISPPSPSFFSLVA